MTQFFWPTKHFSSPCLFCSVIKWPYEFLGDSGGELNNADGRESVEIVDCVHWDLKAQRKATMSRPRVLELGNEMI